MDEQPDWIEKYRAALDQQPQSRTARLSAAFQWVGRSLALALGKSHGKPTTAENKSATRRSPEREIENRVPPEEFANQKSSREKSRRLKPHDKKAS